MCATLAARGRLPVELNNSRTLENFNGKNVQQSSLHQSANNAFTVAPDAHCLSHCLNCPLSASSTSSRQTTAFAHTHPGAHGQCLR